MEATPVHMSGNVIIMHRPMIFPNIPYIQDPYINACNGDSAPSAGAQLISEAVPVQGCTRAQGNTMNPSQVRQSAHAISWVV
jgi:hypothetical protein